MRKIAQASFFTMLVMGVVCAGTLSARQLRGQNAASPFCGGICSAKIACSTNCFCNISAKDKTGTCTLPPALKPANSQPGD
jgi:hypothetical protein